MIFNDEVLFIHVPKTAGMSVTTYLAETLKGEVTNVAPEAPKKGPAAEMKFIKGPRHANLPQAKLFLEKLKRSISDFKMVLSVMRCPYDLEVSRYHYLRLGHAWDKGRAQDLALKGEFKEFCKSAPFQGRNPANIERFYMLAGKIPPNGRIVRFENLSDGLSIVLKDYSKGSAKLAKVNATKRRPYQEYYDNESELAIYKKYQWMFDCGFYSRESFGR